MKRREPSFSDKKKKPINSQRDRLGEKMKDKKFVPFSSFEKPNSVLQSYNLGKQKKNGSLNDLSAINRKKSEQKFKVQTKLFEEKNMRKDKPRVLSQSREKLPKKGNETPNLNKYKIFQQQKNLTERKFTPSIKNDIIKPPNNIKIPKDNNLNNNVTENAPKKNNEKTIKDGIEQKQIEEMKDLDKFKENYDPNLYGFNLYKHVKENMINKDKLCKDKLTKESYYCLDCKISTCKKCLNFNIHNGHTLIPKYLYYNCDEKIFNDTFISLDSLFKENSIILDNNRLKEELKKKVTETMDELIKRLTEIKKQKLEELDKLFESTDGCVSSLKEKEEIIKKDIKNYLEKQKDFYYLQVDEQTKQDDEQNENDADYDVLKNLKLENKNRKAGMIESNNDTFNSTFLLSYDLFKNATFINNEIRNLINDIQANRDKYLTEYDMNLNQINEDVNKFSQPFNGVFNYRYLTNDFYKMIDDKLKKYNEKIDAMRRYIYDMVNKDGNFDRIDKDNRVYETGIKQRFENILNYQLTDKDEALTVKTKNSKVNNTLHRLSLYFKTGLLSQKMRTSLNNLQTEGANATNKNDKNQPNKIYEKPEDIKLDKDVLQKYFAYETYNTVHNNFRYKKPKKEIEMIEEEFDEDFDIAKPIPGTNEMQIYDRKSTTLIRKIVKFDKAKHKYTYFLNGCRSVLIKDMLYILGGVDKEKNTTKMAYVYYLRTNELKVMPEMLKPHAYHSIDFLDYYKSIIVLGGENSTACELYDLNTGLWRKLPDLNVPRAHCNLYLDKFSHAVYVFFGVIGDITEKHNYTDVIEVLELKRLALGWSKIDYNNKAEMDFKSGYNKILPISEEMILIYGATNMRDFVKKAAVYLIPKFEIVKIDNNIFREIKETSKHSKQLSKILSTYI